MKKYLFSITAIVIAVLINSISFAQTHASTNFQLMYGPGSPSDGSIIVRYEQNDVVTQYFANDPLNVVAQRIATNVNNDPIIQLIASASGNYVYLMEKRPGSQYNGQTVELPTTPDYHIIPDDHRPPLKGGTD